MCFNGGTLATVLICEDDQAISLLLETILRRAGAKSITARSGEEALALLASESFDAVVLDLMMPRVNGYAVLDYMRQERPELVRKTVVVSAFSGAMKEPPTDVAGFFSKPFDVSALSSRVSSLIDG